VTSKIVKNRDRKIRPLELQVYRKASRPYFIKQGKAVVKYMAQYRSRFAESVSPDEYLPGLKEILQETRKYLLDPIRIPMLNALQTGGRTMSAGIGLDVDFLVTDLQALSVIGTREEKLITGVEYTTIARVDGVIMDAVASGKSWSEVAEILAAMFDEFAGPPLVPNRNFRTRAEAIAVFEMGEAFEHGSMMQAEALAVTGLPIVKRWITAGDGRVREAHIENEEAGLIPLSETFPSGHQRPPTDPGCRCTGAYDVDDSKL